MLLKRTINALLLLSLIGSSLMWLTSYSHYTSVGIDQDQYKQDKIYHSYYRLRWSGNGSIWLGGGSSFRALDSSKPFERFDLAATLFYSKPELPEVKSNYNSWGFWLISNPEPGKQFWIGIPAFLPPLLIGLLLIFIKNKTKKRPI